MASDAAASSPVAHLLALKAVPPFSGLPPDDLSLLLARARPRELLANEILVAEGTPLDAAYLVLEGRLEEYRDGQRWAERAPYELVGGVDALARTGDGVLVRATTPAHVLELGRDDLLDVCLDRFAVLETVAAGVAAIALGARRRLGPSAGFVPPASVDAAPPSALHDPAELVARLHVLPAFDGVPIHTLAYCAAESSAVAIDAGGVVWHAGDPSDHVVVLLGGTLDCTSDDGAQRFALGPGEVAGLLDAVAGVGRWHDAIARTAIAGLRIGRSALLDVLEDDPDTAVRALVAMATTAATLVGRVAKARVPS